MKATELMIGDIVTFKDTQKDKKPSVCEIAGLGFFDSAFVYIDGVRRACDEVALDELIGLPITPEILISNGFENWQADYLFQIDETQYLDYYPHEGSLERIYIHKDGSREVVFRVNAISYVHLLQHALRLCGIKNEIVL